MLVRKAVPGFTLIELLIVVAIIAILAAIAVPNFLEAQTRAKVARVRSDLRTLATALESYHVDYDDYVPAAPLGDTAMTPLPFGGFFNVLSSPVAYVANSFLRDPFTKSFVSGQNDWDDVSQSFYTYYAFNQDADPIQYWYYTGDYGFRGQPYQPIMNVLPTDSRYYQKCVVWVLKSVGPNGVNDALHFPETDAADAWRAQHGVSWNDYWVMHRLPGEAVLPDRISSFVYDASNGTRSSGDLFRMGGSSACGGNDESRFFQYLIDATNGQ